MELFDAFSRALAPGEPLPEGTRRELAEAWSAAEARYPGVQVAQPAFAQHLAQAAAKNGNELAGLAISDLFLAFACGHGNAAALAVFERELMSEVPAFVAKLSLNADQLSELLQAIRERVLVGPPGAARILGYSGRGPLGGWLRMVAVRAAVDFRRSSEVTKGAALAPTLVVDPELAYIKARHAQAFREAMTTAFQALSDRDATLLRLRYAEGTDTELLAGMYRVSSRTVQRWLSDAHEAVQRGVRAALAQGGRMSDRDLQSLLVLVDSQLELTLRGLLRDP